MSRFIPEPSYPDMMPVDISFVFEDEKPAGKHGFCKADGDNLRFEDGTLAKFWGVNFNGGACFPSHEYSKKVATRLAQAGCNIVRFHQLDAEFDTPNIFAFTKGKRIATTRVLDEKSLDALDYLIFCLKEEGIYCYIDMSTYRKYKEGDGVIYPKALNDNARPWCHTNPRLIELQKEFATQIWSHYNPYTKLTYGDDPVFVLSEIINENDLFTNPNAKKNLDLPHSDYYENEFRGFFRDWLKENGREYDYQNCDLYTTDSVMIEFKTYMTEKYYKEIATAMRAAGCKCPITGTNWSHTSALAKCNSTMDFTDSHHYFYDWKWGNNERVCAHKSITSAPFVFPNLAAMKVANKPFFCSEWDMPWPNSFRAEGPIYYAAVGALQGWSGFTIHTYSYGTRLDEMKVLGREQSTPVGGVPYREGIFSTWNDPAKFGLFYHAALITRRCDIKPAKEKVAVDIKDLTVTSSKAMNTLLEQHRAANVFDGKCPENYDRLVDEKHIENYKTPGIVASDDGQMWRDLKKKIGYINTEKTKIAYGFLSRGGAASSIEKISADAIKLGDVTIDAKCDFGVIALSSLTDAPICESDSILLSTIGRARNTDAQFDGDKMLELGKPPILAEVIPATIHIKTPIGEKLSVHGINAEGYHAGTIKTTYENGVLSFNVGDMENPACYYLIEAE